ncbi:hypothetical protein NDN08_003610 [Rhodosorus marinus]|uniref:RRM domain-containing protein n=1 Tax=Rhodosorus marinus TaxID=101924 RepID=A0AAV8UX03_9RHOD|nr:hypothetical protein NDN08_003610 [Rhodosorus marinus]
MEDPSVGDSAGDEEHDSNNAPGSEGSGCAFVRKFTKATDPPDAGDASPVTEEKQREEPGISDDGQLRRCTEQFDNLEPDENDETCLFVGDLGRGTTEDMLRQEFSKYGQIMNIDMKRDKGTGRSLGYCFIHFKTKDQADLSRKKAHRAKLGSRAIRIGRARRNTALYIADLDPSVTTDQLRNAFQPFGELHMDGTYVMKHCYGFVRYKHRTDAEKAKDTMDGSTIGERTVLVKWGEADLVRSSVQVQFDEQSKRLITKSSLYSTFSKFGKVESVEICMRGDGPNMGVAFVEFEDSDAGYVAAVNAIKKTRLIAGAQVWCHHGRQFLPGINTARRQVDDLYWGGAAGHGEEPNMGTSPAKWAKPDVTIGPTSLVTPDRMERVPVAASTDAMSHQSHMQASERLDIPQFTPQWELYPGQVHGNVQMPMYPYVASSMPLIYNPGIPLQSVSYAPNTGFPQNSPVQVDPSYYTYEGGHHPPNIGR